MGDPLVLPFGVAAAPFSWRWSLPGFPNVLAHFKRMQERQSVKKLLAYEKEVNEGFAKTA